MSRLVKIIKQQQRTICSPLGMVFLDLGPRNEIHPAAASSWTPHRGRDKLLVHWFPVTVGVKPNSIWFDSNWEMIAFNHKFVNRCVIEIGVIWNHKLLAGNAVGTTMDSFWVTSYWYVIDMLFWSLIQTTHGLPSPSSDVDDQVWAVVTCWRKHLDSTVITCNPFPLMWKIPPGFLGDIGGFIQLYAGHWWFSPRPGWTIRSASKHQPHQPHQPIFDICVLFLAWSPCFFGSNQNPFIGLTKRYGLLKSVKPGKSQDCYSLLASYGGGVEARSELSAGHLSAFRTDFVM